MIDYRPPVADILFTLEHAAEAGRLPGWDSELAAEVLEHAGRFVGGVIAPLDPIGDVEGCKLLDGRVRMPQAFRDAYAQYREGGWQAVALDERYGGQGLSPALAAAVSEMLSGACIAFQMVIILCPAAMRTLRLNGSEAQKAKWLPRLGSGEWMATMALTEPQAGSDLGQVRTTAVETAEGWRITGEKIFISAGDHDLSDRILHLVLARTGDKSLGVKGLSLFLCPSHFEDGSRNAVSVLRIEEKMGLHASPTCHMAFDGAKAEIVGAPGEGLARMFTMMNAQRIEVALEGIGIADVAGQRSRAYAAERRQGKGRLINQHDDVRRMLLSQMAWAMGGRAMTYRTLVELECDERSPLVDFMTPVVKTMCTEGAMIAAQAAIQVHGGYGYLREYRVEQLVRDIRIAQIYEGTNGIQAITLAGRLLRDGRSADAFAADVAPLAERSPALAAAFADWRAASETVAALPEIGGVADAYMRLTGLVALGAAWERVAAKADLAPAPERIRAVADFVRRTMLPESAHLARLCRDGSRLGEVDESVFITG